MVFVAVPESAVQGTGADDQAVVRLGHVSAESGDLRDEGREPIRFVTTQVCDTGEYRLALGEGSKGSDGRRQFARIIETDAAQDTPADANDECRTAARDGLASARGLRPR